MKSLARLALGVAALAGATSLVVSAQTVISAKSGLIHYAEGSVYLGDQLVENKFGSFPDVKENAQLRTEDGRAEVLLTPGVFLRLGESSAIRMVTNRLIDTRVEFLSGSVLVEADDILKDNGVTIVYKDYSVQLVKKGLYRFDSDPAELRVYDGEAMAQLNGKTEQVKEGHLLAFNGDLKLARFNKDDVDALYRWSRRRSEYLAMANVSAAKSLQSSANYNSWGNGYWGMGGMGMGGFGNGGWFFNPYFNMYTFVPFSGVNYSPFGYAFWSPFSVYNAFYSPLYYTGGGGGGGRVSRGVSTATTARTTIAATRSGLSGTLASSSGSGRSPSTAASSSSSTSVSRGGGFGGGGGGHAGGHGR